ncbi:uncharacterized protein N7479_009452, partial [Penicillium vulpinum]|uniref:uncharacterized protein n=1 Tax=Penicillium vulpinum TaxID=29845 RepID=UPI00254680B6
FTIVDSAEVVGKVPNPNAGQAYFTTSDSTYTKQPYFAIGLSIGRDQADYRRVSIDFDRGLYKSLFCITLYLLRLYSILLFLGDNAFQYRYTSIAELPQSPLSLYRPSISYPTRAKKLAALHTSFLWYSDLYTENIFVNPERPTEILGIIDWQSTELLPLFEYTRQPYFLDYNRPSVKGLEPPTLPENIGELSSAKQLEAKRLYISISLSALYRNLIYRDNPVLYKAIEFR